MCYYKMNIAFFMSGIHSKCEDIMKKSIPFLHTTINQLSGATRNDGAYPISHWIRGRNTPQTSYHSTTGHSQHSLILSHKGAVKGL